MFSSTNYESQALDNKELFDKITLNKFRIESDLGKGSYASVKLGVDKVTNQRFALKFY